MTIVWPVIHAASSEAWNNAALAMPPMLPSRPSIRSDTRDRCRRRRCYAEWAVRETGFDVAERKVSKNAASSLGICPAGVAESRPRRSGITGRE